MKDSLLIFIIIIAIVLTVKQCKPYHSNSGSMKILRENGEVFRANDTTYYKSNNFENLNELELRAILKIKSVTNFKIIK